LASRVGVPVDDHHQPAAATAINKTPEIGNHTFAADLVAVLDPTAASLAPGFGSSVGSSTTSGTSTARWVGAAGGPAGALAWTSMFVAGFGAVDAGVVPNA
jgi:hypothetical protein